MKTEEIHHIISNIEYNERNNNEDYTKYEEEILFNLRSYRKFKKKRYKYFQGSFTS